MVRSHFCRGLYRSTTHRTYEEPLTKFDHHFSSIYLIILSSINFTSYPLVCRNLLVRPLKFFTFKNLPIFRFEMPLLIPPETCCSQRFIGGTLSSEEPAVPCGFLLVPFALGNLLQVSQRPITITSQKLVRVLQETYCEFSLGDCFWNSSKACYSYSRGRGAGSRKHFTGNQNGFSCR